MKRTDLLSLSFYEKSPYFGSHEGTRFKIEKKVQDEEAKFLLTTWPEPYSFDNTEDSLKKEHFFDYSSEGLDSILNFFQSKN